MWKFALTLVALASAIGSKPLRRWLDKDQRHRAHQHEAAAVWEDEGGRVATPGKPVKRTRAKPAATAARKTKRATSPAGKPATAARKPRAPRMAAASAK